MQHYGDYVLAVEVMYRYGLEQLIGLVAQWYYATLRDGYINFLHLSLMNGGSKLPAFNPYLFVFMIQKDI